MRDNLQWIDHKFERKVASDASFPALISACPTLQPSTMAAPMDLDKESELSIAIPIKTIWESFICPICLEEITDAYMTSCGQPSANAAARA